MSLISMFFNKKKTAKSHWIKNKMLREWTEALLFALVVAFVFRSWLYAPFRVPTGSMIPTIDIGDHIFADMSSYGYEIPFTKIHLLEKKINRGDVIIFPAPTNPPICDSALFSAFDTVSGLLVGLVARDYVPTCIDFIKRVVAIGGDSIEFRGEELLVNGAPEKGYKPFYNPYLPPVELYYHTTVPEGKVFVMGDNRRDSLDGRFWHIDNQVLSYVDVQKVRAQAKWIYLSFDPRVSIFQGGIRFNRMFTNVR